MTKRLLLTFDILILILLLNAEGSRFFEFFGLLSGSQISAFLFALAVSLIIVYLSIGGYEKTSQLSVLICICLSVISYINPFVKEVLEVDFSKVKEIEKGYEDPPKWESKWESKTDKEMRKISFEAKLARVLSHNARIDNEIKLNETISYTKKIAFSFSAFLMSFCVPLLTYLISHKLSKEFTGVIHAKKSKEDIEDLYKKLGGKKI